MVVYLRTQLTQQKGNKNILLFFSCEITPQDKNEMSDKKSQSHKLPFFCTYSSSVSTEVISQRKEVTVQSRSG